MYTGFWWGDLMERHLLKSLGIDGRIIFEGSGMGRHRLDYS